MTRYKVVFTYKAEYGRPTVSVNYVDGAKQAEIIVTKKIREIRGGRLRVLIVPAK